MLQRTRVLKCLVTILLACGFVLAGSGGTGGTSPPVRQIDGGKLAPVQKWESELGETAYGNLITADGVVYLTTDFHVYAIDASTGDIKWKYYPPGFSPSSPAVAGDIVYVGASTALAIALDARTGRVIWEHELSSDRREHTSNPIVTDGLVYFGTGWADYSCCAGSGSGGRITALDAKTGQEVWHIETSGNFGSGGSTFAVANGLLYKGVGYGGPSVTATDLSALDLKTGRQIWESPFDVNFVLAAPDRMLYFANDRELVSVDGKTGQERWKWYSGRSEGSLSKPAVVGDTVYIMAREKRDMCFEGPCAPPRNHIDTLYALDSATGKERWKQDANGGGYNTQGLIPCQNYICYDLADVTTDKGVWYVRGVDLANGKPVWQSQIADSFSGSPVTVGNLMYIGTSNGMVYALQLPK